MAPKLCDPANCPTGKRVDDALTAIEGLWGAIQNTDEAYHKSHDALIEVTTTLNNLSQNIERDRISREKRDEILFSKTNSAAVALAGKANTQEVNKQLEAAAVALAGKANTADVNKQLEKKISRNGVILLSIVLSAIFTIINLLSNMHLP